MNAEDLNRYSRQIKLPGFGISAQEKLKKARVLIIGCGGLGNPISLYLAAAGVGTLGLVEFDNIDLSNLQRQIIFKSNQTGESKLDETVIRLKELNPTITIEPHKTQITAKNALEIIDIYDVVVDGSDNFPTRYLINDACEILNKPLVYGAIFQYEGQAAVFNMNGSATYRDMFPTPPPPEMAPNCAESGVLGSLAGIVGSIQANETIKIITGLGKPLSNQLLLLDTLEMSFRKIKITPDTKRQKPTSLIDYDVFCGITSNSGIEISPEGFIKMKSQNDSFTLIDIREEYEHEAFNIGGVNIPMEEVLERIDTFSGKIVFYCSSGQRAKAIANKLRKSHNEDRFYALKGNLSLF